MTTGLKCKVKRTDLLNALCLAASAIQRPTTLPIMLNAKLEAAAGKLIVTTTDLDMTIWCSVDCTTQDCGVITVPHQKLLQLMEKSNDDEIELSANKDGGTLEIGLGNFFVGLVGMDASEFPPDRRVAANDTSFSVPAAMLKQLLAHTLFSVSTNESRYVLNGVYVVLNADGLRMVATDGRRISIELQPIALEAKADFILPTKSAKALMGLLRDGEVKITPQKSFAQFDGPGFQFQSKTIEGNFPNYKQVVPTAHKVRIVADRALLLGAVERIAIVTNDKESGVTLNLTNNNLCINRKTSIGYARENLTVVYADESFEITVSTAYLIEALSAISDESVVLEANDILEPLVIKAGGWFYVVMPYRKA